MTCLPTNNRHKCPRHSLLSAGLARKAALGTPRSSQVDAWQGPVCRARSSWECTLAAAPEHIHHVRIGTEEDVQPCLDPVAILVLQGRRIVAATLYSERSTAHDRCGPAVHILNWCSCCIMQLDDIHKLWSWPLLSAR